MSVDRLTFAGTVEADGRRLRGSVTLAGARTFRNGEWVEVDPVALMKADATGIFASWEHEDGKILGSSTNGTLSVERTDQGFTYQTEELPNTTYAADALELVRGGYVTGTSFEIEGTRASITTDPDTGLRVRRFTSIKRLRQVGPVRDPAFTTSTVAAFSKENTQMDEPIVEPTAPVGPAPVTFTAPKDEKSDVYRTAEKFARDRETLGELAAAMDNLLAQPSPANAEAYSAMAAVYDERAAADKNARNSAAAFKLAQDLRMGRGPKAPANAEQFASEDYLQAFDQYLRNGNPRHMEQFAQAVAGDGTQGGFTVPDGFLNRITERLKAFGGIAGVSDEITTSTGESLRWPTNDDTGNSAAIAAEGVAGTAGADLVFDSIELGSFSYDANGTGNVPLKVSLELIQDSAFDIASLVERKLGERIGRKQASHLATGAGGTEPVGLLTKTADTMTATAVSLAGPEHIFQVDSAYRDGGNCRWVMSDTTLAKLWTSQTTTNQPLFVPGGVTISGAPAGTFYGYPITIDPAAGTKVAFGDIRRGYIVRRVRGIQLLVDPYSAQGTRQVAYHAWARMDANIQDSYAYSVSEWSTVSADT